MPMQKISRRHMLGAATALPVLLQVCPANATPAGDDTTLQAAWANLIAAHNAMDGPLTEAEFKRLGAVWDDAQDRFLDIRATTIRGVALRLRYLLAVSDGWFPDAGFHDQPPAEWPQGSWREEALYRTIKELEDVS